MPSGNTDWETENLLASILRLEEAVCSCCRMNAAANSADITGDRSTILRLVMPEYWAAAFTSAVAAGKSGMASSNAEQQGQANPSTAVDVCRF